MLWTPKTERALYTAASMHEGQYRKGPRKLPYIVHPVAVASIVSRHIDDEDIVAAGLLHDTLEDTVYTKEAMEAEFGERVAAIVLGVTIPEPLEGESGAWAESRVRYLDNLAGAPDESALVAAADKMHNFSAALLGYHEDPEAFRRDFGGRESERIEMYGRIVEHVRERVPAALASELAAVWEEYRLFVSSVRDTTERV